MVRRTAFILFYRRILAANHDTAAVVIVGRFIRLFGFYRLFGGLGGIAVAVACSRLLRFAAHIDNEAVILFFARINWGIL